MKPVPLVSTAAPAPERGVALLAVLFALTLLALLALPFSVSMRVGADAAARAVEQAAVEQGSASARDLLLADAAMSHPMFDATPMFDGLAEYPDHVELPAAFEPLREGGRVLLGGEVVDAQRFLSLDSVSPLVLANLIGTATRLREDLAPDATAMLVEDAEALPETGYLWLANEVVHYGQKNGNSLLDVQRGQFRNEGFAEGKDPVAATALVLDYRCVLAAAWPFAGRVHGDRAARKPYAAVGELGEIGEAGLGNFTPAELDTLRGALSVDTMATTSATWGRPERVFDDLLAATTKSLRVKSALHVGAGSTVRLRNLSTGAHEYGLVMSASTERSSPDLRLPSVFRLVLLWPVTQDFPAFDTVVEPLVPAPVNVNTAGEAVLSAIFAEVRRETGVLLHEADGSRRTAPPLAIGRSQARELAAQIASLRQGDEGLPGQGPFTGWQDFVERVFKPRFEAGGSNPQKEAWIYLYRDLRTGRDSALEMGTAPICFRSGPWVLYRAAASRSRSSVATGIAARHERTGLAAAIPGLPLEQRWNSQEAFEDAFVLDRRAPFWVTTPVNLGGLPPNDQGNDPAPRYIPHLISLAYPDLGLGAPRYATTDAADAGIRPATALAPSGAWTGVPPGALPPQSESFPRALDPRGHDVAKDGPYKIENSGPSAGGGGGVRSRQGGGGRHDHISFPFSNGDGFVGRFATSFWVEPKSLEGVTLLDHSDGNPDRNRISLQGKDGNLVYEVLDEAGLDPNPSDSPAGVERTASVWQLPLAELGLPADTPVHVNVGAYGSRPGELSFAVDGMTRGKPKYKTYLTAAIKPFDPSLANNQGPPGQRGNDRYIDVQVESTEGFPPVGILRIGLELFEYSSISGNSFQCQWKDSLGGRGARQIGQEHRPDIPVDQNGLPTVDVSTLQQQGVNLDVFPEHPAGAEVELYGYSALLSEDIPMMVGTTRLSGAVGGWALARGFIDNPIPITIPGTPLNIGFGIDENWHGDLQLADPKGLKDYPPKAAQAEITDAFEVGGGYALLVQWHFTPRGNLPGQPTNSINIGGIEVIKYGSRQGNKLRDVQRNQTLPGNNSQIDPDLYDQTARRYVCNYLWSLPGGVTWNELDPLILWVVPISLQVQNARTLWDPVQEGMTEWVQLYPDGGDESDTEWVRYDAVVDNGHLVRANRRAWERTQYTLTPRPEAFDVGTLGPNFQPTAGNPWGTVEATSGYIGYVPKLESTYPQIQAARRSLQFRGDPFTRTSSHKQSNSVVMQCNRLQLHWNNFGALTGRVGRNDRVALVQGSVATGTARPAVEWHTCNWSARRFEADNLAQDQTPPERLGPWPFQLVAFQDGVKGAFLGPPRGTVVLEPRMYDRVVKFPSGELPAAYCENVTVGGGVGNTQPISGFVDEIEVFAQAARDGIVDEAFTAAANTFVVSRSLTYNAAGTYGSQTDVSGDFPATGGLVMIDSEIIAYQSRADGQFTVAQNGRGLLNTEPRDHDRGARVHFLTHRPMAILTKGIGPRDSSLPVAALGAMPQHGGTVLLGRELLHYAWVRIQGDAAVLEMPRWFPPGEDPTSSAARGLFRGRYGSAPQGASNAEAIISFPFRYWDRYAEYSDDPELAYFQLTTTEAPVFYRTLRWREETVDARVSVDCLVRTDSKAPWQAAPATTPGLWQFQGGSASAEPHRIGTQASRLEVRFAAVYHPGVLDLTTFRAHGWKTSVRVEDVRVDYEGEGCIYRELVTAR
ncbi:MAG TPA: hypothetical protein VFZ65_19935 [Planctomycetota bacterium]|nr:hypothetical protein [Planctomycetota bacterium]